MNHYTRISGLRIFGARVYAHWSVLVAGLFVLIKSSGTVVMALVSIAAYFGMILLHEAGHAYFAKRQRLDRISIKLSAVHGVCTFEEPEYAEQDYVVAWGGIFAQLVVAVPLVVANAIFGLGNVDPFGPIIAILGYYSLLIVAFNLIPAPGLDGAKAWPLVPLLWRRWRAKTFSPAKRRRGKMRALK